MQFLSSVYVVVPGTDYPGVVYIVVVYLCVGSDRYIRTRVDRVVGMDMNG